MTRYPVALGRIPRPGSAMLSAMALSIPHPCMAAEGRYDMAAQDLETALLTFSRISGIDIVYDRAILQDLRSAPLHGRFAPAMAVAILLRDSGLAHRFTSATAVLILRAGSGGRAGERGASSGTGRVQLSLDRLRVTAGLRIGKPQVDYRPFGQLVQSTIMRRLQDNPSTQGKRFQARFSVEVDPQGVIRRPIMVSGSGNGELDGELLRILRDTPLPEAPPAGMPQPVWFEIVQR